MDTSEREGIVRDLGLVQSSLAPGAADLATLLQLKAGYQEKLANFIPEAVNLGERVSDWQRVSNELRTNQNGNGVSRLAPTTLPVVERTQHNRVRSEEELFLLIRQPIFSQYEQTILQSNQQFFGLTGPQGFGKSAFLQYISAKYCNDPGYLVVYLPECPTEINSLQRKLALAFYRGCRIAGLVGYKELTLVDTLTDMIQKCSNFATLNRKQLLLVIDQMITQPRGFFNSTINGIRNVTSNIKVLLSSSISYQVSSVFGNNYQTLDRYSYKVTPGEATLLSNRPNMEISADDLTGLPFQVAAEKISGTEVSLPQFAAGFAEELLSKPGDASSHQAYFYLQMVADSTEKAREEDCMFGTTLNGDHFYVERSGGRFYIKEHREGLAAMVISLMKSREGDYERYLLGLLGNTNFMTLDAGARGRILEDCFEVILRRGDVRLGFLKIPEGGNTNPPFLQMHPAKTAVIEVPGGDEEVPESVSWDHNVDTLVFIPLNRQYKGIDFITVRKTDNALYIYFIQCTIQHPQEHPICESELYGQWEELLGSSTQVRRVQSFLVFLTPHSMSLDVPGPRSIAPFFRRKIKLHVQFAKVQGGHADKIRKRYPRTCP